jgi:DNA processing protein
VTLSERERLAWLRLARSENVGPVTFARLLDRFGSAQSALDALPDLARRGGAQRFTVCSQAEAEKEVAAVAAADATLIAKGEENYPPLLARIEDAPPLIAVKGNAHLLTKRAVGVVGTRNASLNGLRIARMLAEGIGKAGYLIVSGMARGIDGAAHEASLETGTAAALAGGVDVIYPREHATLYERIIAHGVAVSEMPMGTEPHARLFPRRNRIISGIARGLVVVEAAHRSGSLHTARFALEQNREVFAVPGSPLDPRAQGANDLIRDGAHLVQTPEDVLQVLTGLFQSRLDEPPPPLNPQDSAISTSETELEHARRRIIGLLGPAPTGVDELIRQCQMSPAIVTMVLLELELAGRLERHSGNQVSLLG